MQEFLGLWILLWGVGSVTAVAHMDCKTGVPDIEPAHRGKYPWQEQGEFYQYALFSSDSSTKYENIKCYTFSWTKNIKLSTADREVYTLSNKYFNTTTKEFLVGVQVYAISDLDDSLYVGVNDQGKVEEPVTDIGRMIIKKQEYYVDYSWFYMEGKQGVCGYWWQIYGRQPTLDNDLYKDALSKIKDLGLETQGVAKIENTGC